jgi:NAD(P)-dependent dehydrogenase (short-subunit alcohol dehydrogenase family)
MTMQGQTALVTGATSGIGKHIAIGLAREGATLILGSRDRERGEAARSEIAAASNNPSIEVGIVDVASIESIRNFAAEFAKTHDRLHLLVNNAGAWFTERRTSADGYELTLATNVLGPYLLTRLLEPQLAAPGKGRIVNVVSSFAGDYDIEDLEFTRRKYDGLKAYKQSKQALRMLTWGQAERLAGKGITSNAATPGFVKTDLNRNAKGFTAKMLNFFAKLFAVTAEKGAVTPLWVASAPELAGQTAKYFDAHKEKDGKFRDPGAIAALEKRCDELTARARERAA